MEKQVTRMTVQRLLISLGVTPKSNGYRYLTSAIMIKLEKRPGDVTMLRLCEQLGAENNATAASVERSMRFAIERVYNLNKLSGINDLFNAYVITKSPTLSDFIMYLVEYLDSFYQFDDLRIV